MLSEEALSELLSQLDGVANAPLTSYQRELRAQGLLAESGVTVAQIVKAMLRYSLPWNQKKAAECGLPVDTWVRLGSLTSRPASRSVTCLTGSTRWRQSPQCCGLDTFPAETPTGASFGRVDPRGSRLA